jgi:hypothetical protein
VTCRCAGHAVIARVLGLGVPYAALFGIDPNSNAGVTTTSASWRARSDDVAAQVTGFEKDAKVALAGAQAQQRYRPLGRGRIDRARRNEWSSDFSNALSCVAHAVVLRHGDEPVRRTNLDDAHRSEAETLFGRLLEETADLVEQNWPAIERVATALLSNRMLTQDDLDALIADRS